MSFSQCTLHTYNHPRLTISSAHFILVLGPVTNLGTTNKRSVCLKNMIDELWQMKQRNTVKRELELKGSQY